MTFKAITTALVLGTLSLAGCTVTESDAARVDCGTPGPHGVDCSVRRTAGSSGFEACWDLAITCQNGGEMRGSACHPVAAGVDAGEQNMPVASFSNQASCDVPVSGKVEQLKITSRPDASGT